MAGVAASGALLALRQGSRWTRWGTPDSASALAP